MYQRTTRFEASIAAHNLTSRQCDEFPPTPGALQALFMEIEKLKTTNAKMEKQCYKVKQ